MTIDPIIAVKDVQASSKWYQDVFDCMSKHGGDQFDVLVDENENVIICLHKWGEHGHPTLQNPSAEAGNGLILYFRTKNMELIRSNIERINYPVESDIQINPNSHKREFSLRDPDGYYITITEHHNF